MPLVKVPQFRASQRLYAINPATFKTLQYPQVEVNTGHPLHRLWVEAIWFKKTKGVVAIHIGEVWDTQVSPTTPTLDDLIEKLSTARYGGTPLALWNGSRFWSNDVRDRNEQDALIARLDPMLKNYPEIPSGWQGWYQLTD